MKHELSKEPFVLSKTVSKPESKLNRKLTSRKKNIKDLPFISLVIPTYNEAKNVELLAKRIMLSYPKTKIIFVDDNSPDGTAEIIESRLKKKYGCQLIKRSGKLGLSSAVIEGFSAAKTDIFGVIDADLSHPPEEIPKLVNAIIEGADIVVGSRYVKGGGVEVWPWHRRIISFGATSLARPLTRVKDPMSGFFLIKKNVIAGKKLNAKGYKILLEILVKGVYRKAVEVPYVFRNREFGQSKLGTKEYYHYLNDLRKYYKHKLL